MVFSVKMLWNWLLKSFALSLFSLCSLPFDLIGAAPVLSCHFHLIYCQKGLLSCVSKESCSIAVTFIQCDLLIDFCVCFLCCLYLFQSWGRLDFLALEYSLCFLRIAHLSDVVSQGKSCLLRDIEEGMFLFIVVCCVNLFQFVLAYDS